MKRIKEIEKSLGQGIEILYFRKRKNGEKKPKRKTKEGDLNISLKKKELVRLYWNCMNGYYRNDLKLKNFDTCNIIHQLLKC